MNWFQRSEEVTEHHMIDEYLLTGMCHWASLWRKKLFRILLQLERYHRQDQESICSH